MVELVVDPHPRLALVAFQANLPGPLSSLASPPWLREGLALDAPTPVERSEELRQVVRDLLRHGGYKPTGRGKPASEYLVKAAGKGALGSINLLVDACNVVSLHSGLPISVVDLDRAAPPLRVGIADKGARYVFNSAGQEIDVGGLLCLFDREGPCANAVKDSQRTKTHDDTRRSLSLLWAPIGHEDQAARAADWYRELLERADATTGDVSMVAPG
ncbi:MAG: hypothetical protein H6713_29600 [Myxococcales bacterium]|nr:hypothetical protein [Myxococcales bacterium]